MITRGCGGRQEHSGEAHVTADAGAIPAARKHTDIVHVTKTRGFL